MSFNRRLIKLREGKGWTKTQTAKLLNVTVGAYANWEYGNRTPDMEKDFETFLKISDLFDVSLAYLILGKKTIREFTAEERNNYIEELKASSKDNETLSGYKLLLDTTNAMAYEDVIKTYYNWENESDDLKGLLAAVFGFYEAKPDDSSLHDAMIRFLVEFYNSDSSTLEEKLILLDRTYNSLKKKFIDSEN